MSRVFVAWASKTRQMHNATRLLTHILMRMQAGAFEWWRCMVQEHRAIQELTEKLKAKLWMNSWYGLDRADHMLVLQSVHHVCCSLVEDATRHPLDTAITAHVQRWCSHVKLATAVGRWRVGPAVCDTFHHWQAVLDKCRVKAHCRSKALLFHQRTLMQKGLAGLVCSSRQARQLHAATVKWNHTRMTVAFATWQAYVTRRRSKCSSAQKAMQCWLRGSLRYSCASTLQMEMLQ
jgi:hypothetical protein